MARPLLVVTNLDFEYELAHRGSFTTPQVMQTLCERWRHLLRLLPGAEQALCHSLAEKVGPESLAELPFADLRCWGVSARVREFVREWKLEANLPSTKTVREVNDKRFSHRLEREMAMALPGSQIVENLEEFRRVVAESPHRWVLKHPLGVSGRERMVGQARTVSDSALGWAKRQFARGWTLVFEPWVEERRDFSMHFDISEDQEVSFLGHTGILTDPGGSHRGNLWTPDPCDPEAVNLAQKAVQRVAAQGYWGPVGVDAMTGYLSGRPVLRPVVELNCRYSFGRLCLELQRQLPPGWSFLWSLPSRANANEEPLSEISPHVTISGRYRLPDFADPKAISQSFLLAGPSKESLDDLMLKFGH